MQLSVEYYSQERIESRTEACWDECAKKCLPPHFDQSGAWAAARQTVGWSRSLLLFRQGTETVGGAQILSKPVRYLGRIGYISHGPLLRPGLESESEFIARQLRKLGRQGKFAYLAIDLPYYGQALVSPLKKAGFGPHLSHLPPTGLPDAALLLDLKPDAQTILENMRASTRKEIRKGARKGVTVRKGDKTDLPLFWDLLVKLCERRGSTPNVPGLAFLNTLWDSFKGYDGIELFIGELNGAPLCTLIVLTFGDWSWMWRVGNTFDCANFEAVQVTYWEAIKLVKARGSQVLDFLGIYRGKEGRINADANVKSSEQNPFQGINFFKLGFGGAPVEVPGAFGLFPNPMVRLTMRYGGEKLLRSGFGAKLLSRFNRT